MTAPRTPTVSVPILVLAAVATLVVVGVPTDIVDTPFFGREIPVRWWEYPVLAATALLTGLWFGLRAPDGATGTEDAGGTARGPLGAVALAVFAVGCPVCNKIVLLALGTSGALGLWAPLQPVLAVVSLVLLVVAVVLRRRRLVCGTACAVPTSADGAPTRRSDQVATDAQ